MNLQNLRLCSVRRSGSEGIYPHLIDFCESHLEKLEPRSRALRKENPVASVASLSKAERSQIVDELTVRFTFFVLFIYNASPYIL